MTTRTQIAPTLRRAHPRPGTEPEILAFSAADAWRELRHLLALESAVRRWRCTHPGGLTSDEERVVTAHERLTRASRGGR